MKPIESQYFAGFFDKSGSINIIKERNSTKLRVNMTHFDEEPLKLGQSIWGGTVIRNKNGFIWNMVSNQAKKFLNDIKSWSISKKNKIDQILC